MAESAAAEETRVAEAVARLLARQSSLLARATDDAAAASATRLGLAWLTDLMRSFDLHGAADWFQALKARGEEHGTTAAWPALGAPRCEALAGAVSRAGSLAPLGADEGNWAAHVAEVGAFEEPQAHDPGPPQTPEIEPEPQPAPQIEPGPVPPPLEEPPTPTAPEIEPPREDPPDPHAALFEAIADLAGEDTPAIDANHGRIEITGRRALEAGGIDPESHRLIEALDVAAQAAGAVLLASPEAGGLSWIVRLPRPEARHYLFAELDGAQVAVPWSRVVESGLESGSERPRILLGSGLGRIHLAIDWLFGQGEGRPVSAPAGAAEIAAPEAFTALGWVRDAEGRTARVLDLALGAEPRVEAPAEPEAKTEAVQPEPIPADTPPETSPPVRAVVRALVADDSMMARVFLGRLLAQRGIVVEEAEDGAAARALLDRGDFDLVFLDAEMPGAGALEILRGADDAVVARACVLVKDDEERRLAEAFGGLPILYKPFAEDEVRSVVGTLRARTVPGS